MTLYFLLGVPIQSPSGTTVGRGILLMTSVDLPARAIVLNMKNFNGSHGCCYCLHSGETTPPAYLLRFWPLREVPARTHSTMIEMARESHTTGLAVSNYCTPDDHAIDFALGQTKQQSLSDLSHTVLLPSCAHACCCCIVIVHTGTLTHTHTHTHTHARTHARTHAIPGPKARAKLPFF